MRTINRREAFKIAVGVAFAGASGCGGPGAAGIITQFIEVLTAVTKYMKESGTWVLVITGVLPDKSTAAIQVVIKDPNDISSVAITLKDGTTMTVAVGRE